MESGSGQNLLPIDLLPRQCPHASRLLRPSHELEAKAQNCLHPLAKLMRLVAHIGPDQFHSFEDLAHFREDELGSITFRHIPRVDDGTQQETRCINENMAFSAVDLLRRVVAVDPPFSVVFTDCESMMAAEG